MKIFKYYLIAVLLSACNAKQDFKNDLTVPPVLKEYHEKKELEKQHKLNEKIVLNI